MLIEPFFFSQNTLLLQFTLPFKVLSLPTPLQLELIVPTIFFSLATNLQYQGR